MKKVTCSACKNRFSDEGTCPVRFGVSDTDDATNCDTFEPITIFHRITASPEVLAEKLVYRIANIGGFRAMYSSLIINKCYHAKAKAIAATVAKLKEVENGN